MHTSGSRRHHQKTTASLRVKPPGEPAIPSPGEELLGFTSDILAKWIGRKTLNDAPIVFWTRLRTLTWSSRAR